MVAIIHQSAELGQNFLSKAIKRQEKHVIFSPFPPLKSTNLFFFVSKIADNLPKETALVPIGVGKARFGGPCPGEDIHCNLV